MNEDKQILKCMTIIRMIRIISCRFVYGIKYLISFWKYSHTDTDLSHNDCILLLSSYSIKGQSRLHSLVPSGEGFEHQGFVWYQVQV